MKQSISGSVAVLVIAVALIAALFAYNHYKPTYVEEAPKVLPFSPPVDEGELNGIRVGLSPLGISVVWPPLQADRQRTVRVAGVVSGSPAHVAGIQPGDAIQSFNEARISNPFGLVALLERVDPEQPNEAVIVRGGEEITCTIIGVTPLPLEERAF